MVAEQDGIVNYRQIPQALRNRKSFTGNTMTGTTEYRGKGMFNGTVPEDAEYYVYSYNTPIAWVDSNGTVTVPDERYSTTTSRQQNLCRAYL